MVRDDAFGLSNESFVITGGTRGLGRAISLRFAEAGASVVAVYVRDQESADSLAKTAAERGLRIEPLRADLSRPAGVQKVHEHVSESGQALSGLIHCAATGVHKRAHEFDARDVRWVFSLNFEAFLELARALLPHMREGSTVLALSSKGAHRAVPSYGLVGASKGALEAFSRQLAAELAPRGIRVNILSPGAVRTDVWGIIPEGEERLAQAVARTPLGRLVTAEEVAYAAQFLCSAAGSGILGHSLIVDGGAEILE